MRALSFTEVRGRFKEVADEVVADHAATLIHRRDAEDVVLISARDYMAMEETLYLFSTKANAKRMIEGFAEADAMLPEGARILGPEDFNEDGTFKGPVTA